MVIYMSIETMNIEGRKNAQKRNESQSYQRTEMQKEMVIKKLKDQGCRITKQRLILLDIILKEDCSCCKEIYYQASKIDSNIGTATVYRMVNSLEEIGAISRKNMYKIACGSECEVEHACTIELDDNTVHQLSAKKWNKIILEGLKACGYIETQHLKNVEVQPCMCKKVSALSDS